MVLGGDFRGSRSGLTPHLAGGTRGAALTGVGPGQPLPLGFIFTPGNGRAARRVLGSRKLQVLQA